MDPVNHPSERHRSDMLLDLSGLTSEERVMVQVSISNERDFDRVAEALIHRESPRRTKGKGSNVLMLQTLVGFAEKATANTLTGSGKSGASAHHANLTSVEDYDKHDEDMSESANAYQVHNDPVDPGSDDGEEALDYDDDDGNDTFSPCVALDDITVFDTAELDAIALLADTWDDYLDPEASAQLVQGSAQASFSFGKEIGRGKGKAKGKGKGRYPV